MSSRFEGNRRVSVGSLIGGPHPLVKPFDLQSEPFQATGSISADGVRNQLGRPKIDRLTLLVREAIQNSWDARLPGSDKVKFAMMGWQLTSKQRQWLLGTAFGKLPREGLTLGDALNRGSLPTVLAVYDRGTCGLRGPTRADEIGPNAPVNFVNLLRNVGQPPAVMKGGGTYGFGKTALFLTSGVRTILVHTQIAEGKKFEQRLMATALGGQFTQRSRRYTGRHWWGREASGGIVDPLTGREAEEAAKAIGLPLFDREETGTTILILLPDFNGREPMDALRYIGDAIVRNFWPKMIDGPRGGGTMTFELSWNGTRIAVPRPRDVPPLEGYVKAFANACAFAQDKPIPHPTGYVQQVSSQRPIKHLGTLSLIRFEPLPRLASTSDSDDDGPFKGASCHTALMRGPHFVVGYAEGPALPSELAEYAGVFLASDTAEEAFARAEPPTHDAWTPDVLEDRHEKTYVRVAAARIKQGMQDFAGALAPARDGARTVPLGAFSDLLGGLVPAEHGTGARVGGSETAGRSPARAAGNGAAGEGRGSSRLARIRILDTTGPHALSGVPVFTIRFERRSPPADFRLGRSRNCIRCSRGGFARKGAAARRPATARGALDQPPRQRHRRLGSAHHSGDCPWSMDGIRGNAHRRASHRRPQCGNAAAVTTSLSALPFRQADPSRVHCETWQAHAGSVVGPLPSMLPHWDYGVDLRLVRNVSIAVTALRSDCCLPPDAPLHAVAVWRSTGSTVRGRGPSVPIAGSGEPMEFSLSAEVPGKLLAEDVVISTQIVLVKAFESPDVLAPRYPGSILWQDSMRVVVEGTGSRFPVEVVDFAIVHWAPYRAAWFLSWNSKDLDEPFLRNVRLFVNEGHWSVVEAVQATAPTPEQAVIQSAMYYDVGRQLIRGALSNDDFISSPDEYPEGSTGRAILRMLRLFFRGDTLSGLRKMMYNRPEHFDGHIPIPALHR